MPVFNGIAFIDATMKSILAQTFTDFELVVSDGLSDDGTWEALQRYTVDPRVRLTRLPSRAPATVNFETVTSLATGEFIKAVCADDILYPNNLEVLVNELRAHPSAVLAVSSRDVIDASGGIVLRNRGLGGLRGEITGPEAIRRSVLAGTNLYGEPPSALFRRAAFVAAGGWDFRFPFLMDLATYSTLLLHSKGTLIAVPQPLWAFRVSGIQASVGMQIQLQATEVIKFFRVLAADYPELVSRRDVLIGSARARVNAFGRHAVYRWLGRRMHPTSSAANSHPDTSKTS
ncbi:glycosyltransferase [Mycobacterium sp. Marseille-P9652]|uniref:glycosyltransferase n=1 Tax=Mycobacterium sp. Marseille-P9652 TaxID=2654950 RepID=UPI0018D1397C|nr:glycosyltransferase [Mycobacterium sp. Marseille-P9652]